MKRGKYHSGMLRNRVTIQRMVQTRDAGGGVDVTWVSLATGVPAYIEPQTESEGMHGGQLETPTRYRVVLRYRDDVTPRMKLVEESKELEYNITQIIDVNYRIRWMELICEEDVAQ